ncbi:hypothetical protein BASA50_005731 [Batrachochytrium salamandrivorans]|uniref:non-specific serine/threonine protein kinase n=1 Tax=Batrachochytrium salamandrivorans TaxID=1357716 RepID=A0ABQ8FBU6_9FUNG|nr:hypothetical protein BASA60_006126 [Batrachochytrium salamandrivorans]KAH6595522.1 hypothetical protein BASA50_005731 [Batrachochytrium salamandrivorans]
MASLYRSLIFLLSTAAIQVQGGKHGIKDVDHQTQPESQLLTLHTNPQSTGAELICPTYVEQTELTSYFLIQNNEEHSRFAKGEDTYFKSEYHLIKQLNIGWFDNIHLAVKKSSGVKVICKFIRKLGQEFYTVESSPPPECHNTEVSTLDGNHVGAECMSPRPSDLLLPLEIGLQKYLSQPVYENPYVLRVTDYAVTSQAYVLVMEYAGEDWVTFDRYMKEHVKFSVDEVRSIMKELVTALVFLKNLGVLHGSIIEQNMLYNRKTGHMKLINFAFSEPREGWNQDNSVQAKSSDSASRFFDYRPENSYDRGWLRGRVLNGEADLDQRWLDGTVEHESMGTRHDNRALAARLADFLQVACRQYQSTLWKYHWDRLVEVG